MTSKFQRIRLQIQYDLLQPFLIGIYHGIFNIFKHRLQRVLMCSGVIFLQLDNFIDSFTNVEEFTVLAKFTWSYLGVVEEVLDYMLEEVAAGLLNLVWIF